MNSSHHSPIRRFATALLRLAVWVVAALFSLWAVAALAFDFPVGATWAALAFAVVLIVLLLRVRGSLAKAGSWVLASLVVLAWWFTQQPRSDRNWQPDVAETAWADIRGDEVTLHNVRACDYRTTTDYTPHWKTRAVRLSQLTGIDFAIAYWGSPYMAHPIASFQFADAPPICFSIETRKEAGEKYSAIGGFFRQYELTYVVAEESDVIRLRTNVRPGEDVYLYRLNVSAQKAREHFLEYLAALNELRDQPRWYNAATTNCTTSIRTQRTTAERPPWDWRILVNGKGDEMMYERGAFVADGLPFLNLRTKALINPVAKAADNSPDFSRLIREGRPGFTTATPISKEDPP